MALNKRKVDRRKLDAPVFSGAAEVCETRALLSADGICLPIVDADAVGIEDIEAASSEEVGEFAPELAVCTMIMPEFYGEAEVFGGKVAGEEGEVLISEEVVDPSLMFHSFMLPEGGEPEVAVCDGLLIKEEPVVDEEFVDVTTLEDYDPSWAYCSFVTSVPEDGIEVIEDVVDGEKVVVDEEVVFEEGEVIEEDPIVFLDHFIVENGVEIPWRDYHGMNFRDNTAGELPVEILAMTTGVPDVPGVESTSSVMGPVAASTPVATPAVNVPVVANQPTSLPVVVTPTLAIPVNNSGLAPLFVEDEELLVATLAPAVSEIEPLVSQVEATVSSGLDSDFGALVGSSPDNSEASVGELTPIFEDEQDEEETVEVPAAESTPIETEESVSSLVVPQQPVVVASRAKYGRSIDEVMSEFAMSGFAG